MDITLYILFILYIFFVLSLNAFLHVYKVTISPMFEPVAGDTDIIFTIFGRWQIVIISPVFEPVVCNLYYQVHV